MSQFLLCQWDKNAGALVMQLLQVLPSVLRDRNGSVEVDVDFAYLLQAYLRNFDGVCVACPVTKGIAGSGLERCVSIKDLGASENRLKIVPLPLAYGPIDFARYYRPVRRILCQEIQAAEYVILSPHAPIGDWPMLAAREAIKQKKPFVIEADIVYESQLEFAGGASWVRTIKALVLLRLFLLSYRYCLRNSKLALFQGQDVYNAYAEFCNNPHKLYHHIPIYSGDHITDEELQQKLNTLDDRPIEICYAGRAIGIKGPFDWLDIVDALLKSGVKLKATWLGDGPLLPELRARVESRGISDHVTFPGLVADRQGVLGAMRRADIFLYCHRTRESARCLGEALASGSALIGYAGAYATELVSRHGGGRFASVMHWGKLAEIIQHLDHDRDDLRNLIRCASKSGRLYNRESLTQERIDLVKRCTSGAPMTSIEL